MNIVESIAETKNLTEKQAERATLEVKEPKSISVQYYKELVKLSNALKKDIREQLMPLLKESSITNDSVSDILRVVTQLQSKYSNIIAFSDPVAKNIVSSIGAYNSNAFMKKSESQLGTNIENLIGKRGISEMLELQIQKQVSLIKSIPDEFLKNIEVIVSNGLSEGLRHEQIAKQINGIKGISSSFGKLENRVKMIARNEIGNINGSLNKYRQQNSGVKIYEWLTSEDEKVRPSHRVMNKKYCKWDDPTVYADTREEAESGKWKKRSSIGGVQKHPALDYNCRCVSAAVIPNFRP